MEKYLNILCRCPLFNGISREQLTAMLSCLGAKVEFFDKKNTIFTEGSSAKYIGIMLSGSAQVMMNDYDGNRSILSEVTAGEVFCEAFAFAEVESLPVMVVANEPSEILFFDSNQMFCTCNNNCDFHRQLIFNLMKDLATKTIAYHQKIEITSKRTTREKLLSYLNLQAKKEGSRSFTIPFDRQGLADYLQVERSGLSAEISRLRSEGVIISRKSHFELLA